VAFHETFWAVSAGVAPVIALAAVVSAGQASRDRDRVIEASRTVAGFPIPFETEGNPVIRKAWIGLIELYVVVQSQLINVAFQAGLLAVSLVSIADQANVVSPSIAVTVAVLGVAVLAIGGQLAVGGRRRLRYLWDLPRGRPSSSGGGPATRPGR
jgi:hypothetical protein